MFNGKLFLTFTVYFHSLKSLNVYRPTKKAKLCEEKYMQTSRCLQVGECLGQNEYTECCVL